MLYSPSYTSLWIAVHLNGWVKSLTQNFHCKQKKMKHTMNENDFIRKVNDVKRLSPVKQRIIRRLHSAKGHFVSLNDLEIVAQQREFTRRIREIIQENGLDITVDSKFGYRLNSFLLYNSKIRKPFSEKQRIEIFDRSNWRCDVCGVGDTNGLQNLQADHKIPVDRNGTNNTDNGQTLCQHCNVSKKRSCENCTLDCTKCAWAFPEVIGLRTMISIPPSLLLKIEKYAINKKSTINDVVLDLLENL